MKVIIQNKLVDLSWVYAISPLRWEYPYFTWRCTMYVISGADIEISFAGGIGEYMKFESINTTKGFHILSKQIQDRYHQIAKDKSEALYNKISEAWNKTKRPFPTFNIE